VFLPYETAGVDLSSCYVMPIALEDPELQAPLRERLKERWNVQTSLLYQAIHEFTAYRDSQPHELPQSERIARAQVTLPLFPGLSQADQDRVIEGMQEGMAALA
jgi:dTDP-4-amino-4,6-dideoxygalactose transaminase